MLRNLIQKDYKGHLFFNLKWRRLTLKDGVWVVEPMYKAMWSVIKHHKVAQLALFLAGIGDSLIWLNVLNII